MDKLKLKISLEESGVFILKKIGIKLKSNIKALVVIILAITMFISYNVFFRNNEVDALSKYGSRGEEVRTIQTKLKRWGYYSGSVDRNIWKSNNGSCKEISKKEWSYCRSELQEQKH